MNRAHILVAFVLVSALRCCGAEHEFYRTFLSMVDTNSLVAVALKSPALVDTNNTAAKLKDSIVSFSSSMTNGELDGVRLGMTMEQVAGKWGKPPHFWSRCGGGPRFVYNDVSVTFEPGADCVAEIICFSLPPRFQNGLSRASNIGEFLRILGAPTARYDRGESLHLAYDNTSSRMGLYFDEGVITSFRLIRHSDGPAATN